MTQRRSRAMPWATAGEHDRGRDDVEVAEAAGEKAGIDFVAHDDGDDAGLGEAGVVAERLQAGAEKVRVVVETSDAFRFLLEDGERLADGRYCRGAEGGGEDEGRGGVLEVDGEFLRDGDEAAVRGDGLGERAGPRCRRRWCRCPSARLCRGRFCRACRRRGTRPLRDRRRIPF